MKKSNKRKGFTLVELLVVIAILAVLATVAILGYTQFTRKANIANDEAIVSQMNLALQANEALDNRAQYPNQAVNQCIEAGFILENLTPGTSSYDFGYDVNTNRFLLLECEDKKAEKPVYQVRFSDGQNYNEENLKENLFIVVGDQKELEIANKAGHSTYLRVDFENNAKDVVIKTDKGIDVGECDDVASVTYKNKEDQTVLIRTTSGILTIDDESQGTIYHYGQADYLEIIECAMASYHECGFIPDGEITKGRLVIENKIVEIKNNKGETEAVESGVKVLYINSKEEYNPSVDTEFDTITVSAANGSALPEFRRGRVKIADEGTLVIKVQVVEGDSTKEESVKTEDDIWLFIQGTVAQMVVVDSSLEVTGIIQKGDKFVAKNDESIELGLGIKEETPANQKASIELANVYNGSIVDYEINGAKVPQLDPNGRVVLAGGESETTVITDKGEKDELNKEDTYRAAEGYVAYNSTTKVYYKDAELAFNEAEPVNDTVVLLADVRINRDNIQEEVGVNVNGHTISREYTIMINKSVQMGSLPIWIYDYNISSYIRYDDDAIDDWYPVNGTTYWDYSDNIFVTDSEIFDYALSNYPQYVKYDLETIELSPTTKEFYGNSTTLKYFYSGYGTKEKPFIISDWKELQGISYIFELAQYYNDYINDFPALEIFAKYKNKTTYYKLNNSLDMTGAYTFPGKSNIIHTFYSYGNMDLDLNGKKIQNLSNNLFGYLENGCIHDGEINLNGSFVGVINTVFGDYADEEIKFENLNLTGSVSFGGDANTHYGSLVSFAYGIEDNNTNLIANNVTSSMYIKAVGSYAGSLFGYVEGSKAKLTITNSNYFGILEAAYAGGFVGSCTDPGQGYISNGNTIDGTIIGTSTATSTGKDSITAEVSNDAIIKILSATTNLFNHSTAAYGDEFVINHKNSKVAYYKVVLSYSVYHVETGLGGFGRAITNTIEVSETGQVGSGVYKYKLRLAEKASDSGAKYWIEDNAYNFYEYGVGLHTGDLKISVYGFDSNDALVTYEVASYSNN